MTSVPPAAPVATDAWTGGQHSLVRFAMGLWLAWSAGRVALSPGIDPSGELEVWRLLERGLGLACAAAGLALAVGWRSRWAAVVLAAILPTLLLQRSPIGLAALFVLLALALFPPAPYGSLDARGRVDPDGGWRRPEGASAVLLGLLGLSLLLGTLQRLALPDPIDPGPPRRGPQALLPLHDLLDVWIGLAFVPLCFVPRARRWIWCAAFASHLWWVLPRLDGATFLFLFAFDPAWVPARRRRGSGEETLYYDGGCGLCHRAVRFVLAEDRAQRFLFAPLESERFAAFGGRAQALGDTMVLAHGDRSLEARSDAWIGILAALGGLWGVLARVLGALPRALRDPAYDLVARWRKRVFAKPEGACPMLPPRLGQRFLG